MRRHNNDTGDNEMFVLSLVTNVIAMVWTYPPTQTFLGLSPAAPGYAKGPVIRATFFFNLSCNILVVQVETHCCAYYHMRGQLVSQQNTMLQVEAMCCEK